ncbi:MAG: TrkA family potassium uptake protein [Deltaproteobacteria bacterium]|nr:TrkA family potassium uptake protein [Deltaproteobacteria bacterium]
MGKYAVIGLGGFGFHVAKALFEEGEEVIAIDVSRARVQAIDAYSSQAIVQDVLDKDALMSLGLEEMDAIIVSTGDRISTSILVSLYLQEMGAKKVMVKAVDEDHEKILKRVGATQVIHPERDIARRVAQSLVRPNVLDFVPLAEDYDLIQTAPPKEFVGHSLRDLNLRAKYNVHVIAVKELVPENFVLAPPAGFVVKDSDILMLLGKTSDLERIKEFQT